MKGSRKNNDRLVTGMIVGVSLAGILYFGWRAVSESTHDARENPFAYTVEAYKKIDPGLLRYTEIRTVPIGAQEVHSIAIDRGGNLYVSGDERVFVIKGDGRPQFFFATSGTATCIAADAHGDLYLGLTGHIEVYDRNGVQKARWKDSGGQVVLTSIAVTGGYVYAADAGNRILRKYDKSGTEVLQIGGKDESRGIPGSIVPSPYYDVAIDPEGTVWLANPGRHTLENYTPEGDLRASWGTFSMEIEGFCGCCNPGHIAILDDGRIVTAEKGIARVKVYDRRGNLESVVAGPGQFAEGTEGLDLASDGQGRIYVLDPAKKAVRIFERKKPGA
jgi:sugar lactone lactonase YvrE